MRPASSFDFGLTGFAERFHQDWRHDGSAVDVLAALLGPDTDPREVEALRSDALLMRRGLTGEEIETLWGAGTGGTFWFGPDGVWPSGPSWLEVIAERCDQWLRTYGEPEPEPEPGRELADTVAAEIRTMTAAVPERLDPGHAVADALLRCVQVSPDLAFRWCLRIARLRGWPLQRSQYERLVALGEQFEYGEFIVSDAEYLTE
ncbi:hypothetical protein ACFQZ8_03360 [Micromonospora azadirachtae]|uniref:CdiI immunity protein domain-containing protein n=1 Tax=Micromonospora azadirachtae TaxID=1970735 RepID=A0ABW2ZWX0_9ACTN